MRSIACVAVLCLLLLYYYDTISFHNTKPSLLRTVELSVILIYLASAPATEHKLCIHIITIAILSAASCENSTSGPISRLE